MYLAQKFIFHAHSYECLFVLSWLVVPSFSFVLFFYARLPSSHCYPPLFREKKKQYNEGLLPFSAASQHIYIYAHHTRMDSEASIGRVYNMF